MISRHTTTLLFLVSIVCTSLLSCAKAFTISSSTSSLSKKVGSSIHNVQSPTSLSMAGFGGSSSTKKNKKKKNVVKLPKLKAKSQWDRYNDMKQCKKIPVGVRIIGEDEDWIEVGRVRSLNDEYTEVAVARQRALIAEHSKRLYPIKVPPNVAVEWGYIIAGDTEEDSQWMVVDKSKGDDAPKDIEKKIGFEGISDKATGFYCYYHEGRIVEKEEEGMGTRGGAFKAVKGK